MSTDTKDMTDTVEQVAFGAAETVAEVASDPIGSVRRQVKSLEKKGTPTARRINRKVNTRVSAVAEPARDASWASPRPRPRRPARWPTSWCRRRS